MQQISGYCEGCPCHHACTRFLSDHGRERLMEAHYGEGIRACPASGMRAPELAAGMLEQKAREGWTQAEAELLAVTSLPNAAPLQKHDQAVLMKDFLAGQTHMMALLKLKTGHWLTLPWKLAGLAVQSETIAREVGKSCLHDFGLHPLKEAHHRVTWSLLQPCSEFRTALQLFVDGQSRDTCGGRAWMMQLAIFRCMPVVERSIESKHAKVSLAERAGRGLPPGCRVSLANRLPMMRQWLVQEQVAVEDIVHRFSAARNLSDMVRRFSTTQKKPHPQPRPPSQLSAPHILVTTLKWTHLSACPQPNEEAGPAPADFYLDYVQRKQCGRELPSVT